MAGAPPEAADRGNCGLLPWQPGNEGREWSYRTHRWGAQAHHRPSKNAQVRTGALRLGGSAAVLMLTFLGMVGAVAGMAISYLKG